MLCQFLNLLARDHPAQLLGWELCPAMLRYRSGSGHGQPEGRASFAHVQKAATDFRIQSVCPRTPRRRGISLSSPAQPRNARIQLIAKIGSRLLLPVHPAYLPFRSGERGQRQKPVVTELVMTEAWGMSCALRGTCLFLSFSHPMHMTSAHLNCGGENTQF